MIKPLTATAALFALAAPTAAQETPQIAFSPVSMEVSAMQGLAAAVGGMSEGAGLDYTVVDPKFDASSQAQQLEQLVSSGRLDGAWVISIRPGALRGLLSTAMDRDVALVVSGRPGDYGQDGPLPGIAFSDVNHTAYGSNLGGELASCITERMDGQANILFFGDTSGSQATEEVNTAMRDAISSGAPDAEIVAEGLSSDRLESQQRVSQMLQANPDANAVIGVNDENGLGAITAFRAAGRDLPCVVSGGGSPEAIEAVGSGEIYAVAGFDFEGDAAQNFATLQDLMQNPEADGPILEIPIKLKK